MVISHFLWLLLSLLTGNLFLYHSLHYFGQSKKHFKIVSCFHFVQATMILWKQLSLELSPLHIFFNSATRGLNSSNILSNISIRGGFRTSPVMRTDMHKSHITLSLVSISYKQFRFSNSTVVWSFLKCIYLSTLPP